MIRSLLSILNIRLNSNSYMNENSCVSNVTESHCVTFENVSNSLWLQAYTALSSYTEKIGHF